MLVAPFGLRSLIVPGALFVSMLGVLAACSSATNSGAGTSAGDAGPAATANGDATTTIDGSSGPDVLAGCTRDPGAPAPKELGASDPTGDASQFTLAKALEGFPAGSGKLTAAIITEKGAIRCQLSEADAPISVANFVGLARGTRPFLNAGVWKTGRFYDGKIWHRVIPGFVIQGGDPLGTGTGGPGYDLPQENHAAEVTGALAMAASDAPSGSQFYIVVGKGPANDYNVFGLCDTEVANQIAAVPVDKNDKPTTPVHMQKIEIARCP